MGFCDVALSEVIAGKLSYEARRRKTRWLLAPIVTPDGSFREKGRLGRMGNNTGFTRRNL